MAISTADIDRTKERLKELLPTKSYMERIDLLPSEVLESYYDLLHDPQLRISKISEGKNYNGVRIKTPTGLEIQFQEDMSTFDGMYVNGNRFYLDPVYDGENMHDILQKAMSGLDGLKEMIDLERTKDMRDQERRDNSQVRERGPLGRSETLTFENQRENNVRREIYRFAKLGAGLRSDAASDSSLEAGGKDVVRMDDAIAYIKMKFKQNTVLTRDNFTYEVSNRLSINPRLRPEMIEAELSRHKVSNDDLVDFLFDRSEYRVEFALAMAGISHDPDAMEQFNFTTITQEEQKGRYLGRLMEAFGQEEMDFDFEKGVARITSTTTDENGETVETERFIRNLNYEDENGIYHAPSGGSHIPHMRAFFAGETDDEKTRRERLRVIDPTQESIDQLAMEFALTKGELYAKPILDTTRDFVNIETVSDKEFGRAAIATLKRKIKLDDFYKETNSMIKEREGALEHDSLGAVSNLILDDDAKGVIDPYGTSNGANLGYILYLAKDAKVTEDGHVIAGEAEFSEMGEWLNDHIPGMEHDSFNRNQMTFTNALVALDYAKLNVVVADTGCLNAEDAKHITDSGRKVLDLHTGDKLIEGHGNKGVSNVITLDMDPETIKERHLENAIQMQKNNPEVHIFDSPQSISSRKNLGFMHEAMASENKMDYVALDGTVVKDAVVQMIYFKLPQTAEHKSIDYGAEDAQGARNYSTQYRHGMSSKLGKELYDANFIDPEKVAKNKLEVKGRFERLGIGVYDYQKGLTADNISNVVSSPVTFKLTGDERVSFPLHRFVNKLDEVAPNFLKDRMLSVNIDIGDYELTSPLLREYSDDKVKIPIKDENGRNVLPLRMRVSEKEEGLVSFGNRYNAVFNKMQEGEPNEVVQKAYERAVYDDMKQITKKNNIMKNIETVSFVEGAGTVVIVPDPSLPIDCVRDGKEATGLELLHRDPVVRSSNVVATQNVGHGDPNVVHVSVLIDEELDMDHDGDTGGKTKGDQLHGTEEQKQQLFELARPSAQMERDGNLFLSTGSRNVVAVTKAAGINIEERAAAAQGREAKAQVIHEAMLEMMDNPKSWEAGLVSFENEATFKKTFAKAVSMGIPDGEDHAKKYQDALKEIGDRWNKPVSRESNRQELSALNMKSEGTGRGGDNSNKAVFNRPVKPGEEQLNRAILDVTYCGTQAILQMKKNADMYEEIAQEVRDIRDVFNGTWTISKSRQKLLEIGGKHGLSEDKLNYVADFVGLHQSNAKTPKYALSRIYEADEYGEIRVRPEAKDKVAKLREFVDGVPGNFGEGVLTKLPISTETLAYKSAGDLKDVLRSEILQNMHEDQQRQLRQSDMIRDFQDALYKDAGLEQRDLSKVAHAERTEALPEVTQESIQKEIDRQNAMEGPVLPEFDNSFYEAQVASYDGPVYGEELDYGLPDEASIFMPASLEDMMPPEEPSFDPSQFDMDEQTKGLQR